MALCPTGKGRPTDDLLRRALYQWAFNAGRHDQEVPEAEAKALAWVERNAPAVVDLDSAKRMRTVLEHLAKRQDGKPAAANTFRRRRAVLSNCLRLAVEHELLPGNPLLRVHWETPKAVEELDVRSVATPSTGTGAAGRRPRSRARGVLTWSRSSRASTTRRCARKRCPC